MNGEKHVIFIRSSQLVDVLKSNYPDPVLLLGPPGVGKSESVREFVRLKAEELGLKPLEITYEVSVKISKLYDFEAHDELKKYFVYKDLRLTEMAPEDFSGIPRQMDSYSVYSPFSWIRAFSLAKYGVLFIDEITNTAREDLLSAAYKLILDRMAGEVKFSEGIMCIGAGNYPQGMVRYGVPGIGVRELPMALNRRFRIYFVEPPTVDEWKEYTRRKVDYMAERYRKLNVYYDTEFAHRMIDIVSDFVKEKGMLLKIPEHETLYGYPNPASWTNLCLESPKWKNIVYDVIKLTDIPKKIIEVSKGEKTFKEISDELMREIKDVVKKNPEIVRKVQSIIQSYVGPDAAADLIVDILTGMPIPDAKFVIDNIFKILPEEIPKENTILVNMWKMALVVLYRDLIPKICRYYRDKRVTDVVNFSKIFYCGGYATVIRRFIEKKPGILEATKSDFVEFAKLNGMTKEDAEYLFADIQNAAECILVQITESRNRTVINIVDSFKSAYSRREPYPCMGVMQ